MLYYLLLCKSLTYAQRSARVLEQSGITVTVSKVPQSVSIQGCAYCVKVSERKVREAINLLRQAGLAPGRAFTLNADGTAKEVGL